MTDRRPRGPFPTLAALIGLTVGLCALLAISACDRGAAGADLEGPTRAGAGGADQAPSGGGQGGGGAAGTPREEAPHLPRTISTRSPFGNVEPGNFVMNGDFELGIGAVVPGWYAIADDHVMAFRYRTGGACRSGLLCAEIASGQSLVATMVSLPPSGPVTVAAYAKPRSGRTGDVTIRLTLQDISGHGLGGVLLTETGTADEIGFVRYEAVFEVDRPYDLVGLVVEARDSSLVDDVSVRAGAPAQEPPFAWPQSHSIPASVDRVVRLARAEARGRRFAPAPRPATVAPPVALPR